MNDWLHTLLNSDPGSGFGRDPQQTLFVLLLAFVLGQVIGWIYMWTHRVLSYSQTFTASLVILPVLVALMMLLMSGSMVIAFGLLAVFAVVRFRNVLKDTRDTAFVLWAIIEGMSVGTLNYSTAVIGLVVIALILVYLRFTAFGSRHQYDAVVNLILSGDGDGIVGDNLLGILTRYSIRVRQAASHRSEDRTLDISYRLLLRDPDRLDELQRDLEQADGVRRVALFMREDESEV